MSDPAKKPGRRDGGRKSRKVDLAIARALEGEKKTPLLRPSLQAGQPTDAKPSLGLALASTERSWWEGPGWLLRLSDPAAAQKWDDDIRVAKEDQATGRAQRLRETFRIGYEPLWLGEAKQLYRHIGTCLSLLSHHPDLPEWAPPDDIRQLCEKTLRRFVERVGTRHPETLELGVFLDLVDDTAHRRGLMKNVKEEGHYALAGALAMALGAIVNREYGARLLENVGRADALNELLQAWPVEKPLGPGRPSKWEIAASLWRDASQRTDVSAKAVRVFWQKRKKHRRRDADV